MTTQARFATPMLYKRALEEIRKKKDIKALRAYLGQPREKLRTILRQPFEKSA